jgi:hypothetical protein
MPTFRNIRAGDKVYYQTPQGQDGAGRAQMLLLFADHVVVDRGDGQPVVVNDHNYVRHVAKNS